MLVVLKSQAYNFLYQIHIFIKAATPVYELQISHKKFMDNYDEYIHWNIKAEFSDTNWRKTCILQANV